MFILTGLRTVALFKLLLPLTLLGTLLECSCLFALLKPLLPFGTVRKENYDYVKTYLKNQAGTEAVLKCVSYSHCTIFSSLGMAQVVVDIRQA